MRIIRNAKMCGKLNNIWRKWNCRPVYKNARKSPLNQYRIILRPLLTGTPVSEDKTLPGEIQDFITVYHVGS